MTPGEILSFVTGLGGVVISIYTIFAKGRDTAWTQAEGIRKELQTQIDELRDNDNTKSQQIKTLSDEVTVLKIEVADHQRDKKTFAEFLEDFIRQTVAPERITRRAQELYIRLTGHEVPPSGDTP